MRTTVNINDELLLAAKRRAQDRGQTLGDVLDDALRRELSVVPQPDDPPIPIFDPGEGGKGLNPRVDLTSNRAVQEFLDEGRPWEKLR